MRRYQQAFTIIELMVVLAVAAVLLTLAVPSFQRTMQNNRVVAASEEFASALNYARAEAIRRGGKVSLCSSTNGSSCGGGWSDGFIVVLDSAATDSASSVEISNAATDVLRVWKTNHVNTQVSENNSMTFVRFLPSGLLASVGSPPVNISIRYTGCSGDVSRQVSVGVSGAVSVARVACPEG